MSTQHQRIGVGVQVVVRLNRDDGAFVPQEDPVGVVIAPGQDLGAVYWNPPTADDPSWIVEFDEPFFGLDGSGPHESARVPERFLEIAPSSN